MTILKLTLLVSVLLAAQDPDRERQIEQARAALRDAEARLAQAESRVRRDRDRFNTERNRANLLSAEADRLEREARELERQLVEAQYKLADTQRRFDTANSEHASAKERLAPIASRIASINDKIADEKKQRLSDFEQSPQVLEADGKATAAEQARDAAVEAVKAKTADNAEYVKLRVDADRWKEQVEKLRASPGTDPTILAQTSKNWMDATSAADAYLAKIVDADIAVVDARARFADAQKQRAAVRAQFDESIKSDPAMAAIEKERSAAANEQAELTRQVRSLSAKLNTANTELTRVKTVIANADREVLDRRRTAQLRRRESEELFRLLALAEIQLRRTEDERDLARRRVQEAADRLRRLQQT